MKSPISNRQLSTWTLTALVMVAAAIVLPKFRDSAPQITGSIEPLHLSVAKLTQTDIGLSPNSGYKPGLTVLSRTDNLDTANIHTAPVAAGADAANGYGISLGEAQAFSSLSTRFAQIEKMNLALFRKLEPRAIFIDTPSGLSARLVAGPFDTQNLAKKTCEIIFLPAGINCKTQAFDGDLISRQ